MNEEEKEEIELDIEAKYVDKTEKEFLSRVTYAECIYILTPENKYCDKIKELSVLKICEIIKNLQKENEELKNKIMEKELEIIGKEEYTKASMGEIIEQYYTANEECVTKQKIKDKIEELKKKKDGSLLSVYNVEINYCIRALQELLEEEGDNK